MLQLLLGVAPNFLERDQTGSENQPLVSAKNNFAFNWTKVHFIYIFDFLTKYMIIKGKGKESDPTNISANVLVNSWPTVDRCMVTAQP